MSAMRLRVSRLILGTGLGLGLAILPAQAQVSDAQVANLVEALRQAAPQTGRPDDGLYSDWQIQPANIPRWSQACIGRSLSPSEFEADIATARQVLVCVMRDVLQDEYRNSGSDEAIAVRRSAAWWMTGDPNRYSQGETAAYTERVLRFYQQGGGSAASAAAPQLSPQLSPQQPVQSPSQPSQAVYDRYMQAGYAATGQGDYDKALLYFQRALDERPGDRYAQQAIQNVENYRSRRPDPSP